MPLDFGLLSMTELRNRPGEVLDRVADDGAAFIIERNGRQKACLVPLSAFFPDIQPTRIADEIEELVQHGEEPRTTFTEARELAFRFPCRLADDTSIEATIFLPHGYPNNCPRVYQSGARWLLDHTRPDSGKKFDLLFRDNVTYGFRRNALGARPLGIVIACSSWFSRRARLTPSRWRPGSTSAAPVSAVA